jgi:hypothetical protein
MMESGLVLEEYLDLLTPNVWFESGEYMILRTDMTANLQMPADWVSCEISPDNTGYVILTVKIR